MATTLLSLKMPPYMGQKTWALGCNQLVKSSKATTPDSLSNYA